MAVKKGSDGYGDGYGTEFGGDYTVRGGAKVKQGPIVQDTDRVKHLQEILGVDQTGKLDAKTRHMLQALDGGLHDGQAKGFDAQSLARLKEIGGDKGQELAQVLEGMKKDGTLFYQPKEVFKFDSTPVAGAPKVKEAGVVPDDVARKITEGGIDAVQKEMAKPTPQSGIINMAEVLAHAMIEETRLRERYEKLRDSGRSPELLQGDLALADKALQEQMAIYDKVKGMKNGGAVIEEAQRIHAKLDDKYDKQGIDKRHIEVMKDVHKIAGDGGPKVSPVAGPLKLVEDFTVRPVTIKTPTQEGDKPGTVMHATSVDGLVSTGGKGLDDYSKKFVSAFLEAAEAIGFAARKPEVKAELAISNSSTLG